MTSITLTPSQFARHWCVYQVDLGLLPFYIGACPISRLFALEDARNNTAWASMIGTQTPITVALISTHLYALEARAAQRERVAMLKPEPWANIHGKPLERPVGRQTGPVRDMVSGEVYGSAAEAAAALNVSRQAMCDHLATPRRLARLAGREFERVT